MSRGLGSLQRDIKEVLAKTVDDCGPLGIADLWQWLIARAGGGREDALRPARERCDAPSRDWSTGARY